MCRKCGFGGDLDIASPDALLDGHRIAQILAAGDATSRASLLALHALGGEMGYPSAKTWSWPSSPGMALEPRQRWKGTGNRPRLEHYWTTYVFNMIPIWPDFM